MGRCGVSCTIIDCKRIITPIRITADSSIGRSNDNVFCNMDGLLTKAPELTTYQRALSPRVIIDIVEDYVVYFGRKYALLCSLESKRLY